MCSCLKVKAHLNTLQKGKVLWSEQLSARSTTGLARSLWEMEGQRAACHSKERKRTAAVPMAGNSENTPWKAIPLCMVMRILRHQPFFLQRMIINNFYIILGVCKVLQ